MATEVRRQNVERLQARLGQLSDLRARRREAVQVDERRRGGIAPLTDVKPLAGHVWKPTRALLAVLYDIHANLPALEAVVADARANGATMFFLGGDYAGFGPFPQETLEFLDALEETTMWIRGNGERWFREPPIERPDVLEMLREHPPPFDESTVERLYRLPFGAEG